VSVFKYNSRSVFRQKTTRTGNNKGGAPLSIDPQQAAAADFNQLVQRRRRNRSDLRVSPEGAGGQRRFMVDYGVARSVAAERGHNVIMEAIVERY
jgi:hypothetical protein